MVSKENKEKDERTRREEYEMQTNRKNIGEGRKISNPYGSSRTSQEFS